MRHTFTAVFDDHDDAQHVLDELLASGCSGTDAVLSCATLNKHTELSTATASAADEGLGESLMHMLTRFLHHHDDAANDSQGDWARDLHVVTLISESELDTALASQVLSRFSRAGIAANQAARDGETRARVLGAYPPGTEPGALQTGIHIEAHYFGTHGTAEPFSSGSTYKEKIW